MLGFQGELFGEFVVLWGNILILNLTDLKINTKFILYPSHVIRQIITEANYLFLNNCYPPG